MAGIARIMQQIRDFINIPRRQNVLLKDPVKWNILCSCMDTIEDTDLALEYYENATTSGDCSSVYLLIYGAQQTLYVQQDAVKNLYEVLNVKYDEDKSLKKIRDIRNFSTGHPTKRNNSACGFIARGRLKKECYQLKTIIPGNKPKIEIIYLYDLVSRQKTIFEMKLSKLLDEINKRDGNGAIISDK